jgi:phosphatidylserine/phosphatidylglycerophosphate/cardiolipin synthase-like enzyme
MTQKRAHFFIPEELLAAMDKLAGKGKRNSLVVEILDHEIRRRRLMQILSDDTPIWKDEDHPELRDGAYAWVRSLRDAGNKRLEQQAAHWDPPSE